MIKYLLPIAGAFHKIGEEFCEMMDSMRRRFWLLLPVGFLIVAGLSAVLKPSPLGMGTHRSLGLPDCLFLHWTGIPCPGCGLTTSFAWMAHGAWQKAFAVHPLGPFLFLAFGLAAILAAFEFFGHSTPLSALARGKGLAWAYVALVLYVGTWAYRWVLPNLFSH